MRLKRLRKNTFRYLKRRKKFLCTFFAGFTFGLICAYYFDSFQQSACDNFSTNTTVKDNNGDPYKEQFELHYVNETNIEPFVKKHFRRHLFAADELGIKEKLFIAVLSSEHSVNTLGVAINKTIGHFKATVNFFIDKKSSFLPLGMLLVNFNDGSSNFLPLNILKYVIKELGFRFDYYLFLSDKGYIRSEKVYDFVSHISVSKEVYLGSPSIKDGNIISCALEGGIIISQSVLIKVNTSLKWCIENCNSTDPSVNFGRCLFHAIGQQCVNVTGRNVYTSYPVTNFNFSQDIDRIKKRPEFNSTLSVFPIPDNITFFKLHRYFCEVELNLIKLQIQKMKDDIYNKSQFDPDERASISWPIGLPEPQKPKTKFDIATWVYFNETHIFFQDEVTNIKNLIGVDKQDIENIIKTAMDKLNEDYNNKYIYSHLINGYRKYDPMRGMEYILDLAVTDILNGNQQSQFNNSSTVNKRLFLIRPLGEVEFVPMPIVEESSRINIILTIWPNELDSCTSFLESYARLQESPSSNNLALIIVFMHTHKPEAAADDVYSVIKSMLPYYDRSNNAVKTKFIDYHSNATHVPAFKIIDMVSELLEPDALMLTCTVGMLLNTEMLNRVRINTIPGWQVFFPIGFWQYKPNIIYDKKPYPTEIEFSSRTGHYDVLSYEYGGFYNSDYKDARKSFSMEELMKFDSYEMFVRYGKVHVFRAVEPEFKHYYMQLDCPVNIPAEIYERCLERKSMNLASRAQLTKRIFQYQAKSVMLNRTHG